MTKDEAETKLRGLPLDRVVTVADSPGARQSFRYPAPGVDAYVEIDIGSDPTPEQYDTLARNLPLPDDKRAEAATKLRASKAAELTDVLKRS